MGNKREEKKIGEKIKDELSPETAKKILEKKEEILKTLKGEE